MRFAIVVKHFVQVFAGDTDLVGEIVVASSDHDLARPVVVNGAVPVGGGHPELAVLARNRLHPLVLPDVQMIVLGDPAIIFQRFQASGLASDVVKGISPISSNSGVVKNTMLFG